MNNKINNSYVAMEELLCPICGVKHSYKAGILLNKRLQTIKPEETLTGYGICEEDQQRIDDGYIALVIVDPSKSNLEEDATVQIENVYRTGGLIFMKRAFFSRMVNKEISEDTPMVFIDPETAETIKKLHDKLHNTTSVLQ